MLYVWLEDAKKKLTRIIGPGNEGTIKDSDNEDKRRLHPRQGGIV